MNAINFLSMEVRWVGFKYFGGHGFHVATSAGPKAQRLDSSEGTWAPIGNNALVPKQLFFLYTCFVLFLCRVLVVSLVFLSIAEAERTLLITVG